MIEKWEPYQNKEPKNAWAQLPIRKERIKKKTVGEEKMSNQVFFLDLLVNMKSIQIKLDYLNIKLRIHVIV